MRRSILSIIASLLLAASLAQAQTTTIRGGTSTNTAGVTNGALNVAITSGGGSGGTAQADNSALGQITGMGALYNPSPPAITSGLVGVPVMDSSRRLIVSCASGCSGSSFADNAAFTFGTTPISPMAGVLDDTATNTATENAAAVARITAQKALHVNIRAASGTELGTAASPLSTSIIQGGNTAAVNASGQLSITCANCSGSGASAVDNSAFTVGTTSGTPIMGLLDDTTPSAATEDRTASLRMSPNRNLYVRIRDNAGNERGLNIDANGELGIGAIRSALPTGANTIGALVANQSVNNTQIAGVAIAAGNGVSNTGTQRVTISSDSTGNVATIGTSITAGTGAAHLGKAEDAMHASGDTGVAVWTKRTDTAATSSSADGDYSTLNSDATGRLWVNTEFPDAAALADATANPTVPGVGSYNMCWNGTTWDRCARASSGSGTTDSSTARVTVARAESACPNYAPISQTADATVIAGTASQYIYICSIVLIGSAAETISFWEGSGTACGTGSLAIMGSTTEANGMALSPNGGFTAVSALPWMRTFTSGNDVCLRQVGTNRVSGMISYMKG